MQIQFTNQNLTQTLNIKNFNLFYSFDNQHELLFQNFQDCFSGKSVCSIDNLAYKKTDYNICFMDHNLNEVDSEKFKKNSIEYQSLENNINFEVFNSHFSEIRYNYQHLIKTYLPHLNIKTKNITTLDLITTLFGIELDQNNDWLIYRLLLLIDSYQKSSKPTFILFNNTFSNNHNIVKQLLEFMQTKFENIYFFYFTNNLQTLLMNTPTFFRINNVWKINDLNTLYKHAFIINTHKTNLYSINDYFHFHNHEELQNNLQNDITILSWYNMFTNNFNFSNVEKIFFYFIFNNKKLLDDELKELLWVEEL